MFGGAQLNESFETPMEGIQKMLELGQVTMVFCKTHTSFIFSIKIPPTTTPVPFYRLNAQRTAIDEPIYSIVVKFAVIMSKCQLEDYTCTMCAKDRCKIKKVEKGCVKKDNILRECQTQQLIYYDSVQSGYPVCPGIIDLLFLRSQQIQWVEQMIPKCDENGKSALRYLVDSVKKGGELAMITMDYARGKTMVSGDKCSDEVLTLAAPKIIAGILKLAQMGYINYDYHSANIIISVEGGKVVDATMIDFGRVAKIKKLDPAVIDFITERANFSVDQLLTKMITDPQFFFLPYNVMMSLAAIADIDLAYNITRFDSHTIQCRDIMLLAFDGKVDLDEDPGVLYPNRHYVPNEIIKEAIEEYRLMLKKKVKPTRAPWGIGGKSRKSKKKF